MDELERMKKGGRRRDPALTPHVFVQQPTATESIGGMVRPSAACGECGGSADLAIHGGVGDSVAAIRERQGPFGE